MSAYYNEIDPFAAQWLRELIKKGVIADGIVDERSIEDVIPTELAEFTQCHFFAGIGVWSYALRQAGWSDDRPVWTGSCPCQPFSAAGKRGGIADERHLWPDLYWLIQQCRPNTIFGEQVAGRDGLAWLDAVSSDLETCGYAVGAADLCAAGLGAPHIRQRLFWVANSGSLGISRLCAADSASESRPWGAFGALDIRTMLVDPFNTAINNRESGILALADGVAARVGRLRGYGNAIVAPVAQAFVKAYLETEELYG